MVISIEIMRNVKNSVRSVASHMGRFNLKTLQLSFDLVGIKIVDPGKITRITKPQQVQSKVYDFTRLVEGRKTNIKVETGSLLDRQHGVLKSFPHLVKVSNLDQARRKSYLQTTTKFSQRSLGT